MLIDTNVSIRNRLKLSLWGHHRLCNSMYLWIGKFPTNFPLFCWLHSPWINIAWKLCLSRIETVRYKICFSSYLYLDSFRPWLYSRVNINIRIYFYLTYKLNENLFFMYDCNSLEIHHRPQRLQVVKMLQSSNLPNSNIKRLIFRSLNAL